MDIYRKTWIKHNGSIPKDQTVLLLLLI